MQLLVVLARLEAERIEVGVQMAAHAVGADHHQRADAVARGAMAPASDSDVPAVGGLAETNSPLRGVGNALFGIAARSAQSPSSADTSLAIADGDRPVGTLPRGAARVLLDRKGRGSDHRQACRRTPANRHRRSVRIRFVAGWRLQAFRDRPRCPAREQRVVETGHRGQPFFVLRSARRRGSQAARSIIRVRRPQASPSVRRRPAPRWWRESRSNQRHMQDDAEDALEDLFRAGRMRSHGAMKQMRIIIMISRPVLRQPLSDLDKRLAEPRGRRRHLDAGRLHRRDLVFGAALAARDDRTGMAHATSRRGGAPRDEADHRLLAAALGLVLQELRRIFFRREPPISPIITIDWSPRRPGTFRARR